VDDTSLIRSLAADACWRLTSANLRVPWSISALPRGDLHRVPSGRQSRKSLPVNSSAAPLYKPESLGSMCTGLAARLAPRKTLGQARCQTLISRRHIDSRSAVGGRRHRAMPCIACGSRFLGLLRQRAFSVLLRDNLRHAGGFWSPACRLDSADWMGFRGSGTLDVAESILA